MGLSFWLVSKSSREDKVLREEMAALRDANEDIASAPFPPHVTLIAGIQTHSGGDSKSWTADSIWEAFLAGHSAWKEEGHQTPIVTRMQSVTTRGMYFQCILLALEKTEALQSLNTQMRERLSLHEQSDYFPHCSLLYATLSAEEAQQQIEKMRRRGIFTTVQGSDEEVLFGQGSERLDSLTLDAVQLWSSNGPVGEWRLLKTIDL